MGGCLDLGVDELQYEKRLAVVFVSVCFYRVAPRSFTRHTAGRTPERWAEGFHIDRSKIHVTPSVSPLLPSLLSEVETTSDLESV